MTNRKELSIAGKEPSKRNGRGRGTLALFVLLLCAAILLPIAGISILSVWDSNNTLSRATPVWVHPLQTEDTIRSSVDVVLDWTAVPPVLAPNWSGVVTAVDVIPVGGLMSGTPLATIDGIVRLAVHTDSPFYRSLQPDDSGPDVAMLNALLAQRGLEARDDDYFGSATLRGVRNFAASIGVPGPDDVAFFDQSWLVFLPNGSEGVPGSVLTLEVGAPAPSAGSKLVEPTLRLASGVVTAPGAVITDASSAADVVDLTQPVITAVRDSEKLTLAPGAILQYGSVTLPIDGASMLTSQAIATLADITAPGQKAVKAVSVTSSPLGSVLIPSTAIFASSAKKLCVIRRTPEGTESLQVEVLFNAPGTSVVTGKLSLTDEVLIAPPAEQRICT